jgi:hypothetical protein
VGKKAPFIEVGCRHRPCLWLISSYKLSCYNFIMPSYVGMILHILLFKAISCG